MTDSASAKHAERKDALPKSAEDQLSAVEVRKDVDSPLIPQLSEHLQGEHRPGKSCKVTTQRLAAFRVLQISSKEWSRPAVGSSTVTY